jgi:large subunit ribosomal protein L4
MPTNLNVKNQQGADTGAVAVIEDAWLEREKGEQAVKDSVVAFLARQRSGTACTKNRAGMSSRSQAKPWRQKGTGRARSGGASSPIWRGGAVAFGPVPRSYEKHVNKKVEKLALKRAFTDRLDEGVVIAVDDLKFDEPKTKQMLAFLKAVEAGDDALVLVDEYTENVDLAARNLPNVLVLKATSVNPYLLLLFKKIIITTAGLKDLGVRLA